MFKNKEKRRKELWHFQTYLDGAKRRTSSRQHAVARAEQQPQRKNLQHVVALVEQQPRRKNLQHAELLAEHLISKK